MNIGWWAADNTDNIYCGKDGGTAYRHPLLSELNSRGHTVYLNGPDPGNYEYDASAFYDFGIDNECWRFRDSLEFIINQRPHAPDWRSDVEHLDVLIVEMRSREFDEFGWMWDVIDAGHRLGVPVLGFDRNNWGQDLPSEAQKKVHLLRPYMQPAEGSWSGQTFFPYPYDPDYWPHCTLEPQYDLVYVGNRYGREEQMDSFLDGLEDLSILVAGNWPDRDQSVTEQYDHVQFVGSTPHFSTIPFLALGRMTFHVGKPDYHRIGMFTPRLVEAALADRVCAVSSEHDHTGWCPDQFVVNDTADVLQLLSISSDRRIRRLYKSNLWTHDAATAAVKVEVCTTS